MTSVSDGEGVTITFVMDLKPAIVEMMAQGFADALPATREFPGCRSVHAYRSNEAPNRLILIEQWDSREAYQAYLDWRQEAGMLDMLRDAMATPTAPEFWMRLA